MRRHRLTILLSYFHRSFAFKYSKFLLVYFLKAPVANKIVYYSFLDEYKMTCTNYLIRANRNSPNGYIANHWYAAKRLCISFYRKIRWLHHQLTFQLFCCYFVLLFINIVPMVPPITNQLVYCTGIIRIASSSLVKVMHVFRLVVQ